MGTFFAVNVDSLGVQYHSQLKQFEYQCKRLNFMLFNPLYVGGFLIGIDHTINMGLSIIYFKGSHEEYC